MNRHVIGCVLHADIGVVVYKYDALQITLLMSLQCRLLRMEVMPDFFYIFQQEQLVPVQRTYFEKILIEREFKD